MRESRGRVPIRSLYRDPGRLCQALDVTGALDGWPLSTAPFIVLGRAEEADVVAGPRIGIIRGVDAAWRFCLAGSRFLSRPTHT